MTENYYKCIAFDIRKFYGKSKYYYPSIVFFVFLLVISYVPMYYDSQKLHRIPLRRWMPTSFGKSILMRFTVVDLEASLLILFITFLSLIIFFYFNSSIETDFDGLKNKVLVGYVSFTENNIEINRVNGESSIDIDYKNIISYQKNYYGEIGHYYWIELKDEIFYISFFNHNYANEIEELMKKKVQS